MKSINNQSGATLIETLLYIALATIVLGVISAFAVATTDARASLQVRTEIDQQGSKLIDEITRRIRDAESISSPTPGTSNSTLILITDNPTTTPTTFSLSGGQVYISEGSGVAEPLSNSSIVVDSLIFRNNSSGGIDSISVDIDISYNSTSPNRIYQYEQEFYGSATIRK